MAKKTYYIRRGAMKPNQLNRDVSGNHVLARITNGQKNSPRFFLLNGGEVVLNFFAITKE